MSRSLVTALIVGFAAAAAVRADIILSSTGLNNTLKTMERLKQQMETAGQAARSEALFQLGVEADALASLINDEVAAHGSQEKPLIDLAVARTGELGVAIAYNREKKKFFYDNAAFREYIKANPTGPRAADAEFKILEGEFFQSSQHDAATVKSSADRKAAFLRRYRRFTRNREVSLMLSIDYRDLFRHYDGAGDAANRKRYLGLTRRQLSATSRAYPGTDEAKIAAEILKRLDAELQKRDDSR
jgi:hypothetical protein